MKRNKNISESLKEEIHRSIPFVIVWGFIFVIFITVIFSIVNKDEVKTIANLEKENGNNSTVNEWDTTSLGVVKEINSADNKITYLEIESGQDIILTYSGGSDIRDKYDQIISVTQVSVGEMMDIYYHKNSAKLKKAVISTRTWDYKGVINWNLDKDNNALEIVDSKYKYSKDLVISRDGKLLDLDDLDYKDELTIKGLDREILSIVVTKGHGTLRFSDYDDFVGGIAYIGKREIVPILEDLIITAREGTFDITFEKSGLIGIKKVTLNAEDDIVVSMEEFKKPPIKTGLVRFDIEPAGADLYIDKILYSYDDVVELEYGEYNVMVNLGGYTTYKGELLIDDSMKTVSISLVESTTNTDDEDESESTTDGDSESGESTDTGNESDDSTNTGNESDNSSTTENDTISSTSNYIYIEHPKGASVYLDGEFKGTVPVSFPKVMGTHYFTFIQSGYETKTYTVEIVDDGENVNLEYPTMTKVE